MSDKPTVVEALASVMEEVQSIRKGDHNSQQNFNFRGIDAVVNAVGPALRKHGVIVVPTGAHYDEQRYESRNGAQMRGVTTSVCYRFYGPGGDWIDANVLGEAADSGDKAIPKAFSVAYRTLLLQTLCVPTDEIDPDAQSHERAATIAPRDEVLARNGQVGGDGARDRGKPSPPADDPHGLKESRADAGATDKQKSMIRRLVKELDLEAGSGDVDSLTKREASERIEELLAAKSHEKDAAAVGGGGDGLGDIPFAASWF